MFGVSDETPLSTNLMCNGSEYYLSDCPGYGLSNATDDYCLSGNYQAGVRCIEGIISTVEVMKFHMFPLYSAYTNYSLL